jgi:DNA-binding phage protein
MIDLHKAVKKLCIDKNTTINNLAETMGVNRSSIYSAISNGNPCLKTVEGIADALGVKLSKLIEYAEID